MIKRFASRIFNHHTLPAQPSNGALLVSQPFLDESYFRHAVVSLIDCSPSTGAMGVVLNNRLDLLLGEVFDDVTVPVPLYCGGPLSQDRLFFLHNLGPEIIPDCTEYTPGVFVGGDLEIAITYLNTGYPTNGNIRFFVGYSGWEVGQLTQELGSDVWAVGSPDLIDSATLLSRDNDALWHTAVRALGPFYHSWSLHPLKPTLN